MKLISEETIPCAKDVIRIAMDDGSSVEMIYYIDASGDVMDKTCKDLESGEYVEDPDIIESIERFILDMTVEKFNDIESMKLLKGSGASSEKKYKPILTILN